MIIVRESLHRLSCTLRWAPTNYQLADVLTKDAAEPADLIRATVRSGEYQLSDEGQVLARARAE
eukprot:9494974-Lingulodinium_polyedra.AAC.1